jgi:hypothetical protein
MMIDEAPELDPVSAGFPEDEDGLDPEQVEFYVANPNAVMTAVDHINHWLNDTTIQELIGSHTIRQLRVLVSHASLSLTAMHQESGHD